MAEHAKNMARGMMLVMLVAGVGGVCSALGWGVANAAFAVGRYVGAR